MLDLLEWIVEFFETIWNLLNFTFEGIVTLLTTVAGSIALPIMFEDYIPSFLSASMGIVIGMSVLKMILGRDNV